MYKNNFNPPTPHGVGLWHALSCMQSSEISIHPPRMGWDSADLKSTAEPTISIHPPRMGWDLGQRRKHCPIPLFQSTHPAWGGTPSLFSAILCNSISIHPPRMGWDGIKVENGLIKDYFNPPTPHGVGRTVTLTVDGLKAISIHPPRMGWDAMLNITEG